MGLVSNISYHATLLGDGILEDDLAVRRKVPAEI